MPAPKIAFATPPDTPGWQRSLVLSPAARIVFFAAMLIGFAFLVETIVAMSGWAMKSASPLQHALANLSVQLLPALAGYLILVRLIERRRVDELAPRDIPTFGTAGLILGAVGVLQFEVVAYRLKDEYNVDAAFEPVTVSTARWVHCDDEKKLAEFTEKNAVNLAIDGAGELVYIAPTRVNLQLTQERWPQVRFDNTREHAAAVDA